jgi:hypothetical protein
MKELRQPPALARIIRAHERNERHLCHRGAISEEGRHWDELLQRRAWVLASTFVFLHGVYGPSSGRLAAPSHRPVAFGLESLPLDAITVNNLP